MIADKRKTLSGKKESEKGKGYFPLIGCLIPLRKREKT
jgi:hypothetical protein